MPAQLACIDGALVALAEASIPATDDGLLRGDGVFEVMRLYGGRSFGRQRHMDRMARSAEAVRLDFDAGAFGADIDLLLGAESPGEAQLRVLLTRGGHRIVLLEELPELPPSIALSCVTYAPSRVLDGVKSLSYAANMLAGRLARERGFDEALLVTPHGRVLECPTACFFWVRDGELLTPPLSEHILDSITRRVVLDAAGAREEVCRHAELAEAEEACLASSVREFMGVHRIDGIELEALGPVTRRAAREVAALIRSELD
ncbi:MAG: aminotransferase class IV [Solirubrobacteraceae bacterium]